MSRSSRGRPPGSNKSLSHARILAEALDLLDTEGFEGFTMRSLAVRIGVTPMAIYHHFQDRDGLIRALGNSVYEDVVPPTTGSVRSRIAGLLAAYRAKVVRHPALTLAIFNRPAVFPEHASRITDTLADLLEKLGLSPSQSVLWTHILVDYTHGAALAVAIQAASASDSPGAATDDDEANYRRGVAALLDSLVEHIAMPHPVSPQ